jgi:cytochrome oxidase Cu insertion factor (SCO1/SenC/PrrC family)
MIEGRKENAFARVVLFCLFLLFFSHSPVVAQLGPKDGGDLPATDVERVKVGQPAPDFTLEDTEGNKITLSDFRGKKSVVLVFYRGYW